MWRGSIHGISFQSLGWALWTKLLLWSFIKIRITQWCRNTFVRGDTRYSHFILIQHIYTFHKHRKTAKLSELQFTSSTNVPGFLFAVPGDSTGLLPDSFGWLWETDSCVDCLQPEVGTGMGGEVILVGQADNTQLFHLKDSTYTL